MNKGIIKTAIALIGIDTIKNAFTSIFDLVKEYKQNYVLEEGEIEVIGLLVERDGLIYFMTATTDENNNLKRIENQYLVGDLIEKQLKNL